MLHEVFYWVLNMSITAAVTGLPVMLIRRIKKIPRRFVVFLWLIPFLRMAVPLGVNSPYSLMSLLSRVASRAVVVYEPAEDVAFSMMNSVVAADAYFPITYKSDALRGVFNAASVAWLAVSLALLLTSLLTYCTTLRALKGATRLKDDVYLLEDAASPAVYGIVKPKIVLPANCARGYRADRVARKNACSQRRQPLARPCAGACLRTLVLAVELVVFAAPSGGHRAVLR